MEQSTTAAGRQLEVRELVKVFGRSRVVDDISFRLEGGRLLTLLGPSGSGKTTTMRMIAGFEEPTSGRVIVDGEDISYKPAHRRNIGVVFQNYALFPHLTVARNVSYPLEMRSLPRAEIARRVEQALQLVRLESYADRLPRQLSGGQQQRVALARAIVFNPPVLLMDEPMGALDKRLREAMQVELRHLQKKLGITTISVTHDQVEALVMSDLIAVLDGGKLQQLGTPRQLYEEPVNRFVADFIGESNILQGAVMQGPAGPVFRTLRGFEMPLPAAAAATAGAAVVIRPEHIRLSRDDGDGAAHRCEVMEQIYLGDTTRVRVRLESGDELIAKAFVDASVLSMDTGSVIRARWRADDCRLIGA